MSADLSYVDGERIANFIASRIEFGTESRCGEKCGFFQLEEGDWVCGLFDEELPDGERTTNTIKRCPGCLTMFPDRR